MAKPIVLVMGANGRCGRCVVTALVNAGWQVRAQARAPIIAAVSVTPVICDASDHEAVLAAAQGAELIVHAINPSRYTASAWRHVLPLLDVSIAAALHSGALLMMPGNIYNYGRIPPGLIDRNAPERAETALGSIRIRMEQRLAQTPGLNSVVLTAGDFFGSGAGVWFDQVITAKWRKDVVQYPGPFDCTRAWTWLPDLARAFAAIAERRASLNGFHKWMMPSYNLTGRQLHQALQAAAGRPLALRPMPWWPMGLLSPVAPVMRTLWQMRASWQHSHALDNQELSRYLGNFTPAPLEQALNASLRDLGLLATEL